MTFSWQMAEELAAAHMRELGYYDARRTNGGRDRGLDVIASGAVAQVKHHSNPVGSPDIQRAIGAAHGMGPLVFYSSSGYSVQAIEIADSAGVALFVFDTTNTVTPANITAQTLHREGDTIARALRTLKALNIAYGLGGAWLDATKREASEVRENIEQVVAASVASEEFTALSFDASTPGIDRIRARVPRLSEWLAEIGELVTLIGPLRIRVKEYWERFAPAIEQDDYATIAPYHDEVMEIIDAFRLLEEHANGFAPWLTGWVAELLPDSLLTDGTAEALNILLEFAQALGVTKPASEPPPSFGPDVL